MRRQPGSLLPLEVAICVTARDLRRGGIDEFHGYELAKSLGDLSESRLLTAYGTLYRALARLEKMGLLLSRGEDPQIAARESRPARRLYTLTATGERVVTEIASSPQVSEVAHSVRAHVLRRGRRRWVPA